MVLSLEGLNDEEAEFVLGYIKDKFPEAYKKEGFIVFGSGNAYSIMVDYLDYISGLSDFDKKVLAKKYITDLAEHKTSIKGSTHIPAYYTEKEIKQRLESHGLEVRKSYRRNDDDVRVGFQKKKGKQVWIIAFAVKEPVNNHK
jgi:hypothetical protein